MLTRTHLWLAIWIAIVLALTTFESLVIVSLHYCPPPHHEKSQASEGNQEAAERAGVLPCNPVDIISEFLSPDGVIAAGTIVIALFTIVLGVATRTLVTEARDNSRRQLRAYLFVESLDVGDGGELAKSVGLDPAEIARRTGQPGVLILGKNSGQTPAYRVIHWGSIAVIEPQHENRLTLPDITAGDVPENPVSPGGTLRKHLWFRTLTPEEIEGVRKDTLAIYVYGVIWYQDAFDRTQWTTYRLFYSGRYPPLQGATFTFSQRGNNVSNP